MVLGYTWYTCWKKSNLARYGDDFHALALACYMVLTGG